MEEITQQKSRVPCPYCKEMIIEGAVKCKHCGSNLRRQSTLNSDNWIWARNQPDRKILGVAACLAANFNVSATLVRLIFVLLTFVSLLGLFIYLLLAAVIPPAPGQRSLFETAVDAMGAALDNVQNRPSKAPAAPANSTPPPPAPSTAMSEPPPMPAPPADANPHVTPGL